ncbi:MAG: hypothetical protein IBJ09_13635 [Bacteroidia bacterium]|nr:hypothetical protein [Bacteroidia bacterium]
MKKFIPVLLLALFPVLAHAQKYEITRDDITLHPEATSADISVFSISLGMTREKVESLLTEQKSKLYYYIDGMHTTKDHRIYVYDRDAGGQKKNCILYLIWDNNSSTLSRITFFADMRPYLLGGTQKLLTTEAVDPASDLSRKYLGKAARSEVTLDIPSIGLKHITYFYPDKGLQVTDKYSSDGRSVVFAFNTGKK